LRTLIENIPKKDLTATQKVVEEKRLKYQTKVEEDQAQMANLMAMA